MKIWLEDVPRILPLGAAPILILLRIVRQLHLLTTPITRSSPTCITFRRIRIPPITPRPFSILTFSFTPSFRIIMTRCVGAGSTAPTTLPITTHGDKNFKNLKLEWKLKLDDDWNWWMRWMERYTQKPKLKDTLYTYVCKYMFLKKSSNFKSLKQIQERIFLKFFFQCESAILGHLFAPQNCAWSSVENRSRFF